VSTTLKEKHSISAASIRFISAKNAFTAVTLNFTARTAPVASSGLWTKREAKSGEGEKQRRAAGGANFTGVIENFLHGGRKAHATAALRNAMVADRNRKIT
jgi:hypothetical protein